MDLRTIPAPETQFIKNPLPVPKRHVKKEMDFDIAVPEQFMFYDVEIKPDDDFDIE